MRKIEVNNLTESGAFYEIGKMTLTRLRNFVFALLLLKYVPMKREKKDEWWDDINEFVVRQTSLPVLHRERN